MTIKKAVEHFEFRLSKHWKPTENDINAYNTILKFVEDKHKQQFIDNQLFGKLYIIYYGELLKYYKATVYDKEPQKHLNRVLSAPIEKVIQTFVETSNDVERALEYEIDGVLKHPQQWTEEDKKNINMKKPPNSYDECVSNLTAMINSVLDLK